MRVFHTIVGLSLLLSTVTGSAHAQQAPEIPAPIKEFWSRLAKAKTITYTAREWQSKWEKKGGPVSGATLVNTYEVQAERPNKLRITGTPPREEETYENGRVRHTFLAASDNVLISDGKSSLSLNSVLRFGRREQPIGSLAQPNKMLATHLDMEWVFNSDPMRGFKPSSDPYFPKGYAVFAFTDLQHPERMQKFYFNLKTGELIRSAMVVVDENGQSFEVSRIEFRFWDFDPPLEASTFDTKPPRGYKLFEVGIKNP